MYSTLCTRLECIRLEGIRMVFDLNPNRIRMKAILLNNCYSRWLAPGRRPVCRKASRLLSGDIDPGRIVRVLDECPRHSPSTLFQAIDFWNFKVRETLRTSQMLGQMPSSLSTSICIPSVKVAIEARLAVIDGLQNAVLKFTIAFQKECSPHSRVVFVWQQLLGGYPCGCHTMDAMVWILDSTVWIVSIGCHSMDHLDAQWVTCVYLRLKSWVHTMYSISRKLSRLAF